MEVLDENLKDAPYNYWHMFYGTTISLFNKLEESADRFDNLLKTIIHSSGEFTDVLVPRQGMSNDHLVQYESFNNWLIGRLFYIWSVNELKRIHVRSKDAQVKILTVLNIYKPKFYNDLHREYFSVLVKLFDYHNECDSSLENKTMILENFTPHEVTIPHIKLEAKYVCVANSESCENLMKLTMQLMSESIPLDALVMAMNELYYEGVFMKIIKALENYNLNVKLIIIEFFYKLIYNYDKVALCRFCNAFPKVIDELIFCIEALITSLHTYCEIQDVDGTTLEIFNNSILKLFEVIEHYTENKSHGSFMNICSVVLSSHPTKVFSKGLKVYCLKWSRLLKLPKNIIKMSNLSANEINALSQVYVEQILEQVKNCKAILNLRENFYYFQVISVIECIESTVIVNVDEFLVFQFYHMKRCEAALKILVSTSIQYKEWQKKNMQKSDTTLLSKDNAILIWNNLHKILEIHKYIITTNITYTTVILNILLATMLLVDSVTQDESNYLLSISCMETLQTFAEESLNYNDEITYIILKHLLIQNIFMKERTTELRNNLIHYFISKINKSKTCIAKVEMLALGPWLLLNNIYSPSKFIAEILIPALHSKDREIQKKLCSCVPPIVCMALGSYKIILTTRAIGHILFSENCVMICLVCLKCHKDEHTIDQHGTHEKIHKENIVLFTEDNTSTNKVTLQGQRSLLAKFLNPKLYCDIETNEFFNLVYYFSNHTGFNNKITLEILNAVSYSATLKFLRVFINNITADSDLETSQKEEILNSTITVLLQSTKKCLLNNNKSDQKHVLDCIYEFGLCKDDRVLLPSTKLLVYFIMHPQCYLSPKAVVYLREICESHEYTLQQTYYRYKDHFGKLFVDCSLNNGKDFMSALAKGLTAFGFVNHKDFIAKEMGSFIPYLISYAGRIDVPPLIQKFAVLIDSSTSTFLPKMFPRIYTYLYLYESDEITNKCFDMLEKLTGLTILTLIKNHFRVILTELLLQYCCNPEKVLNGCRYLARHDPDLSNCSMSPNMTVSEIADFLQPKFLGVLAYFHTKLVRNKGALSGKRKALQSFPDIMNLMGAKHVTPLRFKILASLRSGLSLGKEYPKILSSAWSAFVHNIDTISLGPFLATLAVSLLDVYEYAPLEVNKIFQYLVLRHENLLSAHIPDLFFLEESKITEKVKVVIKKHVQKTQPNRFLERIKWYLQRLHQDIPNVKIYAFTCLDEFLKNNRAEIDMAIFGGKNIDPVMVELIDCLLLGCKDSEPLVSLASGSCLGQLGAIEAGHLPRQYVQPDRSPFAFSISDDCFAATALVELTRAFQYEKYTENMDYYAFTIQEMLKIYNISPTSNKKDIWNSLPENMQHIIKPLLNSRYTLMTPQQTKKPHPIFGSACGTSFLEWAHSWTGTLISLIELENIKELLRIVYPSMRRDLKTLLLFMPYVLLHTVISKANIQCVQEEIFAVLNSFNTNFGATVEKSKYRFIRDIRLTTNSSFSHEDCSQIKCCKTVYKLFDFLNRWLAEWFNNKQNPLQNENFKTIKMFLSKFDKLVVIRGNIICGEFERALQYLESYMEECKDGMQEHLSLLAEIYALLDESDSVAGVLSIKRSEPSLNELILAQVVTGRLQDAALCYERLAQEGLLDKNSLQGMVDCYLGLDQPYTAYQLLSSHDTNADGVSELAAEALWRLGNFDQLQEIVNKPIPPSRENWGLIMGRILLSFRSQDHEAFQSTCEEGMKKLLAKLQGEGDYENVLHSGYQSVLGLHIIKEASLAEEALMRLNSLSKSEAQSASLILSDLLEEWRHRLSIVQSDVCTVEPVLRCRRILLQQMQELLGSSHPNAVAALKTHIGNLWLESAKHARKAGNIQQANMYILNADQYRPVQLFIEKAKIYWARGLQDQAFTTLKRALDESYPDIDRLTNDERKICAKAKLLNAKYNDMTTRLDVDDNIACYREAVSAFPAWEKSLVCLGAYYEKASGGDGVPIVWSRRINALNSYGKALLYGHKYLYQSMPRMLSIWLDMEVDKADVNSKMVQAQMTDIIRSFSERLPVYLYLPAFSQIVSRICHPTNEVYAQLKEILVKLIMAYPHHALWMMMCVIKSSYPQRVSRCDAVLEDQRLKTPNLVKLKNDFTQLAEKLIELCNKSVPNNVSSTTVSSLVRGLPRLLAHENFSHIMMPFQEFCKIVLPSKAARQERMDFDISSEPSVYIAGIEEEVQIILSLQKPRKVALKGSDGKKYYIMLKPRDDLRKDFRLMEFNGVVNRFLQDAPETRRRRLYIRTYNVLPLNEECGLIEWVPKLIGLRPILTHIYKQKGMHTSNRTLKELMCLCKDPLAKKLRIFEEELLPRHPPVFQEWFKNVFTDPHGWYQARCAYIRTTAVMSMVGYILGLGDRHGENILFDQTNGDTVHVDFNCLFNKGEYFEWAERVPFRLTHNMEAAMGPLKREGMFRKSCEAVMRVLRSQTAALMSVVGPFVYDPLVGWGRQAGRPAPIDCGERTNEKALENIKHIRQRLNGMVRTKNKHLSLSLSPEGQVKELIEEATSVHNLCQMYMGWGPYL